MFGIQRQTLYTYMQSDNFHIFHFQYKQQRQAKQSIRNIIVLSHLLSSKLLSCLIVVWLDVKTASHTPGSDLTTDLSILYFRYHLHPNLSPGFIHSVRVVWRYIAHRPACQLYVTPSHVLHSPCPSNSSPVVMLSIHAEPHLFAHRIDMLRLSHQIFWISARS